MSRWFTQHQSLVSLNMHSHLRIKQEQQDLTPTLIKNSNTVNFLSIIILVFSYSIDFNFNS